MIPFARGARAPPPSDPTDALRAAVAAGRHLSPAPALRLVFLDGDAGASPTEAAMRRRRRRCLCRALTVFTFELSCTARKKMGEGWWGGARKG
jgi:hypothetical protein